jgi:hypothetical protein
MIFRTRTESDLAGARASLNGEVTAEQRIIARAGLWRRAVKVTSNDDEAREVFAFDCEALGLGGAEEYRADLGAFEVERAEANERAAREARLTPAGR